VIFSGSLSSSGSLRELLLQSDGVVVCLINHFRPALELSQSFKAGGGSVSSSDACESAWELIEEEYEWESRTQTRAERLEGIKVKTGTKMRDVGEERRRLKESEVKAGTEKRDGETLKLVKFNGSFKLQWLLD